MMTTTQIDNKNSSSYELVDFFIPHENIQAPDEILMAFVFFCLLSLVCVMCFFPENSNRFQA